MQATASGGEEEGRETRLLTQEGVHVARAAIAPLIVDGVERGARVVTGIRIGGGMIGMIGTEKDRVVENLTGIGSVTGIEIGTRI